MILPDRTPAVHPLWFETRVQPGRGNVGTGLFDRVFFVDVFDGSQGIVRVLNLTLASATSRLSEVVSTGHEVALEDDLSPMLLLPRAGRIFCAAGTRDLVARPGQVMVVPRGRRRTVTMPDGDRPFHAFVLRLREPGAGSPLANGATLELSDLPDLSAAVGLMTGLAHPDEAPRAVLAARLQAVETLVAGTLEGLTLAQDAPTRLSRTDRARRRAEALLREHHAEDIAIRDVADRVGLSMRQLQHLFARDHGLSPLAWLTRLRLEQAHLRLKGAVPAPPVTDAALSAGFSHLGRFPAQYRRRFGTLPSAERRALS